MTFASSFEFDSDFDEPLSFPNYHSHAMVRRTYFLERLDGQRRMDVVLLCSECSRCYSISEAPLRKTIYGCVSCARELEKVSNQDGLPVYRETTRLRAVKMSQRRRVERAAGHMVENVLHEMCALHFIGADPPHIVGQIEAGHDRNYFYSIMPLVKGGDLFDRIEADGPLSELEGQKMMLQVLHGLKYLHQQCSIAHRDISPENVLSGEDGDYSIIDFGMCLRVPMHPETGLPMPVRRQSRCGKRHYMAPEVIDQQLPTIGDRNDVYDPTLADIWSLGVLLFFALTGTPPMDSATPKDKRYLRIVGGRLHDLVKRWELQLTDDAVYLMQQMLQEHPQQRIALDDILKHQWLTGNSDHSNKSAAISSST